MSSSGRASHIVLDLEFNIVDDPQIRESIQQEIIEIGAVKVDAKGAPIDTFDSLVKPQHCHGVAPIVHRLTGISWTDLSCSDPLPEVLERFHGWCGEGPTRMVTWSNSDKRQIKSECAFKGIKGTVDSLQWYDLQKTLRKAMHVKRDQLSLEDASLWFGVSPDEGHPHRALYDAKATAELYSIFLGGDFSDCPGANTVRNKWGLAPEGCSDTIGNRASGLGNLLAELQKKERLEAEARACAIATSAANVRQGKISKQTAPRARVTLS